MTYANETKGLEAGLYLSGDQHRLTHEKPESRYNLVRSPRSEHPEDRTSLKTPEAFHSNKMRSLRSLLILLAIFSVFAITCTSAAVVRSRNWHIPTEDEVQFQELLATVSDASLNEVLEQYIASKYQTGIWPEARSAIKAVHKTNAAMATSLVELAKRQNVSTTTQTDTVRVSSTSQTIVAPTTTSDSTIVSPGPTTTYSQSTAPSSQTTAPPSTASSKPSDPAVSSSPILSPAPTTTTPTNGAPTVTVPPSSAPTNTSHSSQTTATATPGTTPQSPSASSTSVPKTSSTSSSSASISSTSKNSPITATTTTAGDTSSPIGGNAVQTLTTQEIVYTTVHPDGSRSTITSFTVVAAVQNPTKTASSTPTVTPRLQDAAARFDGTGLVGYALIGFVGMVAVL